MAGRKKVAATRKKKSTSGGTWFIPPDVAPACDAPPNVVKSAHMTVIAPRDERVTQARVQQGSLYGVATRAELWVERDDDLRHTHDFLFVEFPRNDAGGHFQAYARRVVGGGTMVEAYCMGHRTGMCAGAAFAERLLVIGTAGVDDNEPDRLGFEYATTTG